MSGRSITGSFSLRSRDVSGDDAFGLETVAPYGDIEEVAVYADAEGKSLKRSRVKANESAFEPVTDNKTDLGTVSKRFKAAHFSSTVTAPTFSGAVLISDGTAGAPSLAFSGDLDTGVARTAVNSLCVAAGGTAAAVFSDSAVTLYRPVELGSNNMTTTGVVSATTFTGAATDATKVPLAGGTMTGPLKLPLGTQATCALQISTSNTGLYASVSGIPIFVHNGSGVLTLANSGVTASYNITAPAGLVGSPGFNFAGSTNTGFYRPSVGVIGASCAGSQVMSMAAGAITTTVPYVAPLGAVGAPSFSFAGDLDTGIYSSGANSVSIAAQGIETCAFDGTSVKPKIQTHSISGTEANPAYSFASETGTGWWYPAANSIAFSAGGTERFRISDTAIDSKSIPLTNVGSSTGATSFYEEYSDAGTSAWSGIFAGSVTGAYTIRRIGKTVRMQVAETLAVATTPGQITISPNIPIRFNPVATVFCPIYVLDNGDRLNGLFTVSNVGLITISPEPSQNFTGTSTFGDSGWESFSVSWNIV